jgi:hypothetical protein
MKCGKVPAFMNCSKESAFTKKLRRDYIQGMLLFLRLEIRGFNFSVRVL